MHLKSGTLLQGGKYRIEKVLGQGGFGITYLAVQTNLNRKVAIKEFFMKEHCNRDADTSDMNVPSTGSKELVSKFKAKFIKEAQIIAEMDNPHVVQILDVFEGNGTAYYVMKYISGGSLNDHIRTAGTITADKAVNYIRQVADALMYIHARNVLHLDVKPSNILLNGDTAVLIDFGISKHYDDLGGQTSSTPAGISKGYAPLEQYNQGIQTFSPATDIYSLGATLYRMVTGCVPPEASIVNEDGLPPFPGRLPSDIVKAISKSMEPRRKDRPQTVAEFLALLPETINNPEEEVTELDLEPGGDGRNSGKSGNDPSGVKPDDKKPERKSPKRIILLIAAVLLLCLIGYGIWDSVGKKINRDLNDYCTLMYSADSLIRATDYEAAINACNQAVEYEERYSDTKYSQVITDFGSAKELLSQIDSLTSLTQEQVEEAVNPNALFEQAVENNIDEDDEQERERLAKEEAERERLEQERLAKEENRRRNVDFWLREAVEQERLEQERLAREKAERKRNIVSYSNGVLTVNDIKYPMIYVAGGSFDMGLKGRDANDREKPVHRVTLTSYRIGQYEVTQDIWEAVMGSNPSEFKGPRRPVENVSWDDCQEFIRKLNSLTGQNFHLPTEAQWEFAARGGNNSLGYKYSGSDNIASVAWYDDNSGSSTHNVGTKSYNELGIYDMSGNVYEWCSDWYGSYSRGAQSDPKGPSNGSFRVFRGGSWGDFAWYCRVSFRLSNSPGYRYSFLGLRLCL